SKLKLNTDRKESLLRGISSLQNVVSETQALGLEAMLAEVDGTSRSLSGDIDSIRNRISDLNLVLSREKANLENVLLRALEENELDLAQATEDLQSNKQFAREAPRRIREASEQKRVLEEKVQKVLESSKRSQPVLDEFDSKVRRLKEERDAIGRSIAGSQKDLFALTSQASSTQERVEEALGSLRMLGYSEELEPFESADSLLAELEAEYQQVVSSVNRSADRQYTEMYV